MQTLKSGFSNTVLRCLTLIISSDAIIIGYYGLIVAHFTLASIFTSKQPDFNCNVDQDGIFDLSRHVQNDSSAVYPFSKGDQKARFHFQSSIEPWYQVQSRCFLVYGPSQKSDVHEPVGIYIKVVDFGR